MSQVEEDRERFLAMSLEEKRQFYKRERFTTLDQVATWEEFFEQSKSKLQKQLDGAIHKAAGPKLLNECKTLNGCKTGESKITAGYELPARYIIHTVGPQGEYPDQLESCYKTCLDLLVKEKLRSIAFPCISTGVYGYPQEAAANIALRTVRNYLEKNPGLIDRVVFCLFLPEDVTIYGNLLQIYFPVEENKPNL
uniref:Macro domain-containing protein n=1 Tax=Timema genevievae TaxID=629358 RepID=A0A7R9JQM3_TIMGE|nr:unnamed protein product [Timema genevievae]